MSTVDYYLLWLVAGLAIIAVVSAFISWHLRRRVLRQLNATRLLDALARYSNWVAGQRSAILIQDDTQDWGGALEEVLALRQPWFPELRAEADQLFVVHSRLVHFLGAQQAMRLRDPEAWLELDRDSRFTDFWRQHLRAVQAMSQKLRLVESGWDAGRYYWQPDRINFQ